MGPGFRDQLLLLLGIAAFVLFGFLGIVGVSLYGASCARQPTAKTAGERPASVQDPVVRGAYIVRTSGCERCHTPGGMYGLPDPTRKLSGSELGWKSSLGVRYPRNLTPDMATGLGRWSEDQIVQAILLDQHPDRSPIQGPMPWLHYVYFTEEDAHAIAKYLKSIPPVAHQVPAPVPPGGRASGPYIEVPPPPPWDAPRGS